MGLAIPLVGLALSAGLQYAGQQKIKNAQERAYSNQLRKQNQARQEAGAKFGAFLPTAGSGQANLDINAGQKQRQAGYAGQAQQPIVAQPAGSPVLATRDQAAIGQQGNARAKLGGYQDWQMQNAIRELHAGQEQGQIGNFAAGESRLLPLELQDASHAGDGLAGIGSLVGLASMFAGSGLFGGGGNAAPKSATGGFQDDPFML